MDLRAPLPATWRAGRDSPLGCADGGRTDLGLHADPRRAEERRHCVGRSTIARILKAHGLPPVPERPTSWQTFLRAHKDAIAGADFFTTEVWTWRGLVTVYTVFVIHLASRRVQILGSTPYPTRRSCGRSGGRSRWQTPSPAASSFVIGTPNGVDRSASACVRQNPDRADTVSGAERECVRRTVCSVN